MENARAKGGLTLGSSIFAVEVSVCWPYPGRGVQFAASPGRRTLQAGFSRGWRGWTPPHARLAKRGEKAGEEEPVTVAQNLLILGSCFDRRDVLGPDRNQVGGRTVAGLVDGPLEWPKLCNARLRGVDDRRRVGRPWAMAEGARTAPRLEALTARQCQAQLIRQRISKPVLVRQGSESMSLCLDGSWHRCCAHRGAGFRDTAQVRHCEPASVCEMCDHT